MFFFLILSILYIWFEILHSLHNFFKRILYLFYFIFFLHFIILLSCPYNDFEDKINITFCVHIIIIILYYIKIELNNDKHVKILNIICI